MDVESATSYTILDEKSPQCSFETKDPRKPVEHIYIKWTISNFLILQNYPPNTITSPPVHINFASDSWLIELFPAFMFTSERKIQLRLVRQSSKDEPTAIVNYRFGLQKSDITWFEQKSNVSYLSNGTNLAFYDMPEYFDKEKALTDNKFIILCEMYITYKRENDKLYVRKVNEMNFDMSVLSLDLFNLSKKNETSDAVVQVKDLSKPVHKAILAARSSVFSEILSNSESCIKISDDDYKHIKNILLYIYTANFYFINLNGIDIGLYECAKRFNVHGLMQLLNPVHIDLSSLIKEESKNFTWQIDNFSKLNLKLDECITSPPFHSGSTSAPVWNLDIYPDGYHRAPNSVGIYLKTKDMYIFAYLKIDIAILNEFKQELYTRSIDKTLYPNFLYGCPEYVSKKELREKFICDDKLILNCKIKNLIFMNSCDGISSFSHEEFACFDLLSTDMENLLSSKMFSDCTLIAANEMKFFVHKAILSARSIAFEFIIRESEKDNCVIRINDVCPNVLEEILYFCYTGKNKFYDIPFCMKLYEGAKTYKLNSLSRKCINNLLLSVDEKFLCEVIAFSYKHEETALLTRCLIYLKIIRDKALNTKEWQNLSETEEVLACKIYQWLKNPSDYSLCLYDFYKNKKCDFVSNVGNYV